MADSHVVAMTLAERGAYITLLCVAWTDRSLPVDMSALARICRVSEAVFTKLWPALQPCFTSIDGRLIQGRLEKERDKQEDYRKRQSDAGKASVRARGGGNHGSTTVQPEGNHGSTTVQPDSQRHGNGEATRR